MRRRLITYLLLLTLAFTSCVSNLSTTLMQERSKLPQYDSVPYVEYHLKKVDKINVRVFSTNAEISSIYSMGGGGSYQIFEDGTVDLPFADSLSVVGMTIEEAEKAIELRLQNVVPDLYAKVTLATNKFYVIGRSGNGVYELPKERLNIYQALAIAGFNPGLGHLKKVRILRLNEDCRFEEQTFDLRTMSLVNSPYYYIYPNDVIYVEAMKGMFFRVQSLSSFFSLITSSLSFMLLVLNYVKKI